MKRSVYRLALGVVLASGSVLVLPTACVFAQISPQTRIETQQNPGLLTPAPSELLPDREQIEEIAPETPAIDVPEEPPIVQLEGTAFQVRDIVVENNTLVPDAEIEAITARYENRELTLNELGDVVDEINARYRDRGLLTSLAYIPPQDVSSGTVIIRVVEGRIGNLEISGNKFYRTSALARYLDQSPGDAMNIPDLEKALLRMNRRDDLRVRATLSPGDETGETDIRLNIEERQPWQVGLTFDNQGRPFIGTYRWGTEVINRNVTGVGDRFNARWIGAAGTQIALGSYFYPINRHGTEVGMTFGYSYVDVDLEIENQPEIHGHAFNYGLLVSQPLDDEQTWVADAGLNFRRISTYIENAAGDLDRDAKDDIRSLQAGLNFNKYDPWGRTFARGQMTFAPDWMGTPSAKFWKAETYLTRLFRLPHNQMIILRGYSQFTPDALPSAEQFQVGGAFSVRGYTEGLLVGDRGYNVSGEYRWPIPGLNLVSDWLYERLQGAAFVDFGQTWQDNSSTRFIAGLSNTAERTTLLGAGLGLRARLTQYLQGFVDLGWGLLDRSGVEPNAQPTIRAHFGIRTDLLPEDYRRWGDETHRLQTADGSWFKLPEAATTQPPGEATTEITAPEPIEEDTDVMEVPLEPGNPESAPEERLPPPVNDPTVD